MDIVDLGRIGYEDALKVQEETVAKRLAKKAPDTLILAEHFPVVTLGRLAKDESIIDKAYFQKENTPVIRTTRGGNNTFHGIGQLVMYPVVDLAGKKKDISRYIDFLEKTVRNSLKRLGVQARRENTKRGVWSGGKKIAFIGIAAKRWVTFHGVAVNINNCLEPFMRMDPCGEPDIRVTSAKEALGRKVGMDRVKKIFAEQFIKDIEEGYSEWNSDCRNFQEVIPKR